MFGRCQEHKAKALLHSPIPVCPWRRRREIPQHPVLLLCSALELCPLHMFFPLNPGWGTTPSPSRRARPALLCPGVTELRSDSAGSSAHPSAALPAQRGEHSVLWSTIWWYLGHGHTGKHLHLRLLRLLCQGGQQLLNVGNGFVENSQSLAEGSHKRGSSSKEDRSSLSPPTAHLAITPSNFLLFSHQSLT